MRILDHSSRPAERQRPLIFSLQHPLVYRVSIAWQNRFTRSQFQLLTPRAHKVPVKVDSSS
jgi:hypothetical protein